VNGFTDESESEFLVTGDLNTEQEEAMLIWTPSADNSFDKQFFRLKVTEN